MILGFLTGRASRSFRTKFPLFLSLLSLILMFPNDPIRLRLITYLMGCIISTIVLFPPFVLFLYYKLSCTPTILRVSVSSWYYICFVPPATTIRQGQVPPCGTRHRQGQLHLGRSNPWRELRVRRTSPRRRTHRKCSLRHGNQHLSLPSPSQHRVLPSSF